jgi:hypothetical protein
MKHASAPNDCFLVEVARCRPVQQADSHPKRDFDLTALQRAARVDGDKAEHRSPYLGTTMSQM